MNSRLLQSLSEQAAKTNDGFEWAKLTSRIAMHHARQGLVLEANKSLAEIRSQFGNRFVPDVAVMLFVAEGVLAFFKGETDQAFDRVRRGYGVAVSMQARRTLGLAAAWMAHLSFNENRFIEMAKFLRESIDSTDPEDHSVVARHSLVLADAFHFAGSFEQARPWYQQTRLKATTEGDEATLSALLHNIAAFRASNLRLASAGLVDPNMARHALLEAQSAFNFDVGIGTQSFGGLLPLLQAQLHSIGGDHHEASRLLEKLDENLLPERLRAQYWAERALCRSVARDIPGAQIDSMKASDEVSATRDADDRAFVYYRLAETHRLIGEISRAEENSALAAYEVGRHRGEQASLLDLLRSTFPDSK